MCLDTSCSCDVLRKKIIFVSANYAIGEFILVNLSPHAVVIMFQGCCFLLKQNKNPFVCVCLMQPRQVKHKLLSKHIGDCKIFIREILNVSKTFFHYWKTPMHLLPSDSRYIL